ncbi:putative hemolysin [Georgenia satyanarayanai]|uniref:Putative hemolysin n=1 Tax=Georgenia satyanarayanai TaxID=860221 RepID=A0A2Y9BX09_9MICO|nr:hemolysin family protein [Georgenia satyanarayanai]PYG00613.1 putative hemolysin [Georgenia satyanarayanai]SSA40002.1 putative hemolysin [Georgenia satyanarayanai]
MTDLVVDISLVFAFVLLGGVFAASEIALVSLRDSQVRALTEKGGPGARVGRLTEDSNRFLSSVQIGVTLAGFFSASFGAAQIAPQVSPALASLGLGSGVASTVAFVGTTVLISYLSLVFGELVPKRLAMQSAERFAVVVATPLDWIATVMRPLIWLLGASTNLVMRLLGRDPHEQREEIGAEELRSMVAQHESIGAVERDMVVDILAVGDRGVEEIMTPRTEVEFLDADLPVSEAQARVATLEHSRYPVRGRNDDDVLGFVHVRDLIHVRPGARVVGDLVRQVPFFPTGKRVLSALTDMRTQNAHLAVVVDEYGGTDGIVTLEDVVEEFVGEINDEYDRPEPGVRARGDVGDVAGLLGRADVAKVLDRELPEGPFDTLAGFVVTRLGRMPEIGDTVEWEGLTLTVAAMDGRRVDRLHVRATEDDDGDVSAVAGAEPGVAGQHP